MKKTRRMRALWSKGNLSLVDYEFAVSQGAREWECLASRLQHSPSGAAHVRVMELFFWELWREVQPAEPFLASEVNRTAVQNALDTPPEKTPALREIPVENAALVAQQIANDPLIREDISVRCFVILRDTPRKVLLARFDEWLREFETRPHPSSCLTVAKQFDVRFADGRVDWKAWLRSLAVRRLKNAGYTRLETECMLKLPPKSLGGSANPWIKKPKLAERLIFELQQNPLKFGGWAPFDKGKNWEDLRPEA